MLFLRPFLRLAIASLVPCTLAPHALSQAIVEHQKLVPSDVTAGQRFGRSVSLSEQDLLVGASNSGSLGRATVFVRSLGTWSEQAVLVSPLGGGYGLRVVIRDDIAVLGRPQYDGHAYRFERSGTSWSPPITIPNNFGHDDFGYSLAITDAGLILIGAPRVDSLGLNEAGRVLGFCPPYGTFNFSFGDPNVPGMGSVYHQRFGSALAVSGTTILVGANALDPVWGDQPGPGQAFVLEKTCAGGSFLPQAVLTGPGPRFGESVALDGHVAIVGQQGAAFAFARLGSSWNADGSLDPQDPAAGLMYGFAVAVSGDVAAVGAPSSSLAGAGAGAVYVFRRSGGTWSEIATLVGSDTAAGDEFGSALAFHDGTLVVGAPGADSVSANAGAAYVFVLPLAPPHNYCAGKSNSQGCVPQTGFDGTPSASAASTFDISAELELNQKFGLLLYGTGGPAATPFQGGTLCVAPPLRRTPVQPSGGSSLPASDCSGSYHFDFNAWIQGGIDAALAPGVRVAAQYWSRDPQDPFGSALSDAVLFPIGP